MNKAGWEGISNRMASAVSAEDGSHAARAAGEWVVLNVGGTRFHTTRTTLTQRQGTFLSKMFEPDSAFHHPCDSDGAILIDRDGRYFGVVLNYLRHGRLIIEPGLAEHGVYQEVRCNASPAVLNGPVTSPLLLFPLSLAITRRSTLAPRGFHSCASSDLKKWQPP